MTTDGTRIHRLPSGRYVVIILAPDGTDYHPSRQAAEAARDAWLSQQAQRTTAEPMQPANQQP